MAAKASRQPLSTLGLIPWLPILLGVGAIVCTAVWYHYASLALQDTKIIAALISLPPPRAFARVLPSLLAASLALAVVACVLVWALYAWRARQQSSAAAIGRLPAARTPFVAAAGAVNGLLYVLAVWFMVMFAISMLWLGGGMVAAKATMDGANALSVVDETLPRLIKTAMGIDPAESGYLVHVAGRDVDIGKSSCSLFCFTLARAMLADNINCVCDVKLAAALMPASNTTAAIQDRATCTRAPVMCSINAYAFALYRSHMMPALISIVIAVLCVLGLLALVSGTFARALTEQRRVDISRCSSTDADMRVSSSDDGSPKKRSMV